MKPIRYHPEAWAELLAAGDWYDIQQSGVGLDLLDEVSTALAKIENDPTVGAN